jgi:hypothetical protein
VCYPSGSQVHLSLDVCFSKLRSLLKLLEMSNLGTKNYTFFFLPSLSFPFSHSEFSFYYYFLLYDFISFFLFFVFSFLVLG